MQATRPTAQKSPARLVKHRLPSNVRTCGCPRGQQARRLLKRSDVHVARANDLVVADAERDAPLARVEEFLDGKVEPTPTLSWATSAIGRPSSHRCPPGPAVVCDSANR